MKNSKDLYKETFEKIVLSQEMKEKMINIPNENKNKNYKRPVKKLTALLVAAAILVVSAGSVYAGVNLYNMFTHKDGKYAETLFFEKNNLKTFELDKKINVKPPEYMKVNLNYLPENFSSISEVENTKYSFNDTYAMGGLSLILYNMSDCNEISVESKSVIDSEITTINGNKVYYLQKQISKKYDDNHPVMDKNFYMYFADYDVMLFGYVGTDISKDLLYKILENTNVSKSTKEDCFLSYIKWIDETNENPENKDKIIDCENIEGEIKDEFNKIYSIGETFDTEIQDFYDISDISITVDDIVISDDLNMMNEDFKSEYLDENGKIKPLEVTCYGGGDGVNSLDDIKDIKQFNLKYVYATVTYKNNSENNINGLCVDSVITLKSGLSTMSKIDDLLTEYSSISYDENQKYHFSEFTYCDILKENTNNPNYIDVPSKGSVTVNIGYFVPEYCFNEKDSILIDFVHGNLEYDKMLNADVPKGGVYVEVPKNS